MAGTKRTKAHLFEENRRLRAELYAMKGTVQEAVSPRDVFREDRYRAILDGITEGYYEVDLAGHFTFFNSALCRMLDEFPPNVMGMNYRSYLDGGGYEERPRGLPARVSHRGARKGVRLRARSQGRFPHPHCGFGFADPG